MPFREKMKRAFGRPHSDDGSDLSRISSKSSSQKPKKQKSERPDNVYQLGELMPKPKYRGPYNKAHQDKLSAFSFSDAWKARRKSDNSQYSPMGSRLPSLVGSLKSRKSIGVARSRQPSYVEGTVVESVARDDDVGNVGLSRQHTRGETSRPRTAESTKVNGLDTAGTMGSGDAKDSGLAGPGKPFTEDELSHALTQTTLKPSHAEIDTEG